MDKKIGLILVVALIVFGCHAKQMNIYANEKKGVEKYLNQHGIIYCSEWEEIQPFSAEGKVLGFNDDKSYMLEQINLYAVGNGLILLALIIVIPRICFPISIMIFGDCPMLDTYGEKWFIGFLGILMSVFILCTVGLICVGVYQAGLSLTNAGVKL